MITAMESIIRAATRQDDEPLNILLFNSDERYETSLSKTNHNFYLLGNKWNNTKRLMPENFTEIFGLSYGIGFDLVLCLGRYRGLEDCLTVSQTCHAPLVLAELDYPNPNKEFKLQKGDINVFIDDQQAFAWGFKTNYHLVDNCFDADLFTLDNTPKENVAVTNISNWKERDWSHGFRLYHRNIGDAPKKILGETHWQELADEYKSSLIYVNPTTHVYQPIELLEAMACGCIPISFNDTPMAKKFFNGRYDCAPTELNNKIKDIMFNTSKEELDELAMYSFEKVSFANNEVEFIHQWTKILNEAARLPYRGINR